MQSFTTKAVLVLVLYWMFWIPGLIANYLFYREARQTERIAGTSLPGTGCLAVMLGFNVVLLLAGLIVAACLVSSIHVTNGPPTSVIPGLP